MSVRQASLADFIVEHQAKFLPPAIDKIIACQGIVLMEFDGAARMQEFDTTNAALCAPFLEQGYEFYWCDHRHKGAQAVKKETVTPDMEHNSLGVLFPKSRLP